MTAFAAGLIIGAVLRFIAPDVSPLSWRWWVALLALAVVANFPNEI